MGKKCIWNKIKPDFLTCLEWQASLQSPRKRSRYTWTVTAKCLRMIAGTRTFLVCCRNRSGGGWLNIRRHACTLFQRMDAATVVSDVVEKTSTRRRSRIPCVVVEKITTRRREGVGVVVEKNQESPTNFQQNFVWFTYSDNAHRNSVCVIQNK